MSDEFDFVCVGGGLAGLAAGARAAELGARVAILEKGEQRNYPCNSRFSGGTVHVCMHDAMLPAEELRRRALDVADGVSDPDLLEILVSDTRRGMDWLRGHGIHFVRGFNGNWVMAPPRAVVNHIVWEGYGPHVALKALTRVIEYGGGRILLGHRAVELVMRGGSCVGVVADTAAGRRTIGASAVVIADGGSYGDLRLLAEHVGRRPDRIVQRNARQSAGDGLRMAMAAGAASTPLDRFYGHLLSVDATVNDELWPYPLLDLMAQTGIVVDRRGRRVLDEGPGGIYVANELARLDDPQSGIVVFDAAIWDTAGRDHLIPANPRMERAGATIHVANTIEELARKAGIDTKAFVRTVDAYNRAVRDGTTERLEPPRTTRRRAPQPILTPPFRAIPAVPGITYVMGGLAIDADGRVKDVSGSPIPGLYAAGAATGGVEGGPNAVYVGGLCRALVFGMRAAEHAAGKRHIAHAPARSAQDSGGPMKKYPLLAFVKRHGRASAAALALAAAVGTGVLLWPFLAGGAILAALLAGGFALVAGLILVELIRMITDVLMPE